MDIFILLGRFGLTLEFFQTVNENFYQKLPDKIESKRSEIAIKTYLLLLFLTKTITIIFSHSHEESGLSKIYNYTFIAFLVRIV
jgi:hypothetical protein